VQKTIRLNAGIYLLEIKLKENLVLDIKKFSKEMLKSGYYYYAGSAQKNLFHRIYRHLKVEKKKHWHIDYLTSSINSEISRIFVIPNAPKSVECKIGKKLKEEFEITDSLIGFGNSDCRNCNTHLFYSKKRINHNHLLSLYQDIVLVKASSKV